MKSKLLELPPMGTYGCWEAWNIWGFGVNSVNLNYALDINLVNLKGL